MINGQFCWPPKRADQLHGKDAELRGLSERVRYLQQRIEARNAREAWVETYESLTLPT
jgi:hypothetical protein